MDREELRRMKTQFSGLFLQISAILFTEDPIGINYEDNTDEYDIEAAEIILRLETCKSAVDVETISHTIFCEYFGRMLAGPRWKYERPAKRIWEVWQNRDSYMPSG